MTPEDKPLNEKLQEHYKAISSEFSLGNNNSTVESAKAELSELLTTAVQALRRLLLTAESEAVTMSGIKLVFDYTLGKPGAAGSEDELSTLISALTAKPAAESTTPTDSTQ